MVAGSEGPDLLETFHDYQGRAIRLTRRQWEHIQDHHDYMAGLRGTIQETLADPEEVCNSREDPETVRLYYWRYTIPGERDKWMCVVVKLLADDAFVLTAYETRRIKQGWLICRKEF